VEVFVALDINLLKEIEKQGLTVDIEPHGLQQNIYLEATGEKSNRITKSTAQLLARLLESESLSGLMFHGNVEIDKDVLPILGTAIAQNKTIQRIHLNADVEDSFKRGEWLEDAIRKSQNPNLISVEPRTVQLNRHIGDNVRALENLVRKMRHPEQLKQDDCAEISTRWPSIFSSIYYGSRSQANGFDAVCLLRTQAIAKHYGFNLEIPDIYKGMAANEAAQDFFLTPLVQVTDRTLGGKVRQPEEYYDILHKPAKLEKMQRKDFIAANPQSFVRR
jgi:hypothetical protein